MYFGAMSEKYNYLFKNRLEDKIGSRYEICNASNKNYKIYIPETDPFYNGNKINLQNT